MNPRMKKKESRKYHTHMVNEKGGIDNARGGDRWRVALGEVGLNFTTSV
jgi:hypothetical protein